MDLSALAAALGSLVLERRPDGAFRRVGALPPWCAALRVALPRDGQVLAPGELLESFPFLEVFLPAAEAAWQASGAGATRSELWTETGRDGEELHLQATAVRVGEAEALLLRRDEEQFSQALTILQRARELRLTHEALMRETEQREILTHTIVHDLAAPLHSVLGALSLLDEMPLAPEAAGWVQLGLRAAQRQQALIQEILDVFVAERDSLTTDVEGVQQSTVLAAAVRRVAAEQQTVAQQRQVRLELDGASADVRVRVEPQRLFRVVANLLDNAMRASPPGEAIRASVARDERGALLTVEDRGPGVPPEQLPRLFQKLGRGRGRGSGTGLGLYFCRIAVEGWGGGIGYEPRPGGGARFWVRLPEVDAGTPERPATGNRDGEAAAPG